MSDLIAIGMRGFAAVCPADSPLRGARAVFGSQGLWVRGCRSARVPECATAGVRGCRSALVPECAGARVPEYPSARMREVRRAGLVCGNCWLKLAASASEGSSPARIRTEVLSIMSRLLWAAELRGRDVGGVVPDCSLAGSLLASLPSRHDPRACPE